MIYIYVYYSRIHCVYLESTMRTVYLWYVYVYIFVWSCRENPSEHVR